MCAWIACGLLDLKMITTYGNKYPMSYFEAGTIVFTGPLGLGVHGLVFIVKNSPCAFNCEKGQPQ